MKGAVTAQNKMEILAKRIQSIYRMTGLLIENSEDQEESADKAFTTFLLVSLAEEHGLLGDNCNRAVVTALNAVGLEESAVPLYLQEAKES